MHWRLLLLAGGMLAAFSAPVRAQGGACQIINGDRMDVHDRGTAFERVVLRGHVHITCGGGIAVRADTAVSHTTTGDRQFIGRVAYSDSIKALTADRVDFYSAEGRLVARGNVVLTDLETKSVVRGPELDYYRQTETRTETRALVRGRPHATIYDSKEPAPGDSAAPPLEIDADEMEILGERSFVATGRVEFVRGETRGSSRTARFDELEKHLTLIGDGKVEGEEFTLSGERIDATLDGERLREVFAQREAVLLADELRVESPELTIGFQDGELHRMIAVRNGGADTTAPQPRAHAREFWLMADSIDALLPDRQLDLVVAIGDAYGERVADSADAALPELIARDWLRGDTITGYFVSETVDGEAAAPGDEAPAPVPVPDATDAAPREVAAGAAADSGRNERTRAVLERLVAVGAEGRARSLYRLREEKKAGQLDVNFLVANRITLRFRDGEVQKVEADGPIQGLHLQPHQQKKAPPEQSDDAVPVGGPRAAGKGR